MKKVIIITGGARGIGAATARQAAAQGYAVCVNYLRHQNAADALVSSIAAKGGIAMALQADVAIEREVVALFERVDATWGNVSALVNNAGILEKQSRVDGMDFERIRRVLAVNVIGSFLCSREAVRRMSSRYGGNGGGIVNVSSRASRLGSPGEYVDYAASKAAVDTLTIGLAKEVAAEGIRVNAVCPGVIYTDIHTSGGDSQRVDRVKETIPMKRGGQPDEVAKAILWLLSEESSYTTGAFIDVSGGR